MVAVLIVLPFCSDGSIVGFIIGIVMSVFIIVIVVVIVAHPRHLLLCRQHHYVT